MALTCLDLFSGIGGLALGLERSGIRTTAFCERAAYPRAVLAKHWPDVPVYDDVRTLNAARLVSDGIDLPDVICGGFPCQDISLAGRGAGLAGGRSGLWWEFHRLIAECRPAWVVAENVAALRSRGLDEVLGSLAALGYDAEWHCIPASAVGAPHRRDRVWIVAYPNQNAGGRDTGGLSTPQGQALREPDAIGFGHGCADVAHADLPRSPLGQGVRSDARTQRPPVVRRGRPRDECWAIEPDVGRVANGVSARIHRLAALGNSVVPQIPEMIGRGIMAAHIAGVQR